MPLLRRLSVFCGSRSGADDRYAETTARFGRLLAAEQIELIFGGGSVGLMGVLADAVLSAGGKVIGVLPEMLATKELQHPGVTEMHLVPDMHRRKALMAEQADAFVALPGGYGTFEEFFEVVTWAQLGIHRKNIGLLNIAGYFDPLIRFLDHAVQEGFIKEKHRQLIVVAEEPEDMLQRLRHHQMPAVKRWLGPDKA